METMTPPKRLLAATDLSSSSLIALDRGFRIARTVGARYTVLHALGLDLLKPLRELLGEDADAVARGIAAEARERLTEIVTDAGRTLDIEASVEVEPGLASTAIPAFVEDAAIDLVLVGAHGSGFLQRMLLGSTASHLLRKCTCPVLVVKQEARHDYRRILVAVDFSEGSLATVRWARAVAPAADLVLLHVFEVPFEGKMLLAGVSKDLLHRYRMEARERAAAAVHALAQSAELLPGEYTGLVQQGDAAHEIVLAEEHYRCDLIVMGKHGTHITEELLLGSVTKRVLAESRNDVLVIPQHAVDAPG